MKETRIPIRQDRPPSVLLWEADELAPVMLGITIGIFIEQLLICTGFALLLTSAYRKFRDNHPDGYLLHMIYSWGYLPTKARSLVNPFVKRFFP